jgi:photosystem II stability/assembly factor-like uncharacterized protein
VARLVALVACLVVGGACTALGDSGAQVTWYVSAARLLSPTFGYAAAGWQRQPGNPAYGYGEGLYLYRAGRWTKVAVRTDGGIEDVAFPDEQHGWIATYDCARALVSVYRTQDGGSSWRRLPIKTSHSCGGGPTYLSFPDTRDGWLEPVSPNGPGGALFRTTNGGASWFSVGGLGEGIACLKRITALSASTAWMPCGRLLRTSNGGRTWHAQTLQLSPRWRRKTVTSPGDPRFFGRKGVVAVSAWSRRAKAVLFYVSDDGGRTWSLQSTREVAGFCQHSFPWPSAPEATVAIADPRTWWVVSNQFGRIDVTHDGGRHWTSHVSATIRALGWCNVSGLTAGSSSLAWVTTKQRRTTALFETRDGGRSWRPVTFPLR